jgi:D-3-phosphoglycerate dehydrogenase
MIKALITLPEGPVRQSFFTRPVIERLEHLPGFRFLWNDSGRPYTQQGLGSRLTDCEACILNWGCGKLDDTVLDSAKGLRFIGVLGGEVRPYINENFFARSDGVDRVIVNSADVMASSVAEAAVAYMLSAMRKIPFYDYSMKNGMAWKSADFQNRGLFYKTIGLVGLGRVGRYLMEYLKPFHTKFLIYDPYVKELPQFTGEVRLVGLDELLRNSDIVSIHAALTPQTFHMIGKRELSMLKDGTLLVNTARGGIIDEAALAEVLGTGRLEAVLDVFEREPLSEDSPLRKMNNITLIPHMGGPTIDMRQYMTYSIIGDLVDYFEGNKPENIITEERYKIMT